MNPGKRKENETHGTMLRLLGAAQKREVKATQNLSRIVAFFIVCWFPLYTINCVMAFCPSCEVSEFLLNFCIILSHLNSAGNPLLYAYHLKDFRAALKNFIHRLLFPGRSDTKGGPTGLVSVIHEPKGSLKGSQRGLGATHHRQVTGSQQQLLLSGGSRQSSRQIHESRIQTITTRSTVDRTYEENPHKRSTSSSLPIKNKESSPRQITSTTELRRYDHEVLQFVDSGDEEEELVDTPATTASQIDSIMVIEADVNRRNY